jgi:hypothetical protein
MRINLQPDPSQSPVAHPRHVQFGHRLMDVKLPDGLEEYDEMMDELLEMTRVLKGSADAPVSSPYLSLMEVATAYLARAYEIDMLIHQGEHGGKIERGDDLYRFRTGPLRSFIDMARKMTDLGSRRLSQEALLSEQRRGLGERW